MSNLTVENQTERDAMRFLEDQAYAVLLSYKEPVRSADIAGALDNKYSAKLIRHVLAASPRFAQIERKWDLEVRYEDKQRPMERVLREIISWYGSPMSIQSIANELSQVYERPADYYESLLPRLLNDEEKYFMTEDGLYGLSEWLFKVTSDLEEDIIFDNELNEDEIHSMEKIATKVDWSDEDIAPQVAKFIDNIKAPVSNKLISLFRWRAAGEDFNPVDFYNALWKSARLVWMSDRRWATKKITEVYETILRDLAEKLEEEIVEEAPPEVVERAEIEEEVVPTLTLTISERDLDEVAEIVSAEGEARLQTILEKIFEISPRDREYAIAAEGLSDAMRADPRFAWVGSERWRMADTIPEHVKVVPTELVIPKFEFETQSGERIDVELDDEGLEGTLATEIRNPLVQDVGDEEEITEQDKLPVTDSARCVLKYHHLKLGTFPLCQISKSFFPMGPKLIQVTLFNGKERADVWINRETGLIYDMACWYTEDMPESGAVFELVKTDKPDEFQYVYEGKTDPLVHVPSSRVAELLKLKEEVEAEQISTFEIMCRIMPAHRKGIEFITLFTEVNLVRRATRRLVASILSSYYAFYQKPNSALWHFDEKKVDQGFKKAKRKYVRKEG
ncbi:MAG: hypothetical protein QME62_00955 [Armatimonadota bacterium]|nr:hypothetical protein [Armatimonadota bacterium]